MKRKFPIAIILRVVFFIGMCIGVFVMLDAQNNIENRKIFSKLEYATSMSDVVQSKPSKGYPKNSLPQKSEERFKPRTESCSDIKYIVQLQSDIIDDLKGKSDSPMNKVMWLIVASFVSTLCLGVSKLFEMGFVKYIRRPKKV